MRSQTISAEIYQNARVHRDAHCIGGDEVDIEVRKFPGRERRTSVKFVGNAKTRNLIIFHLREREREISGRHRKTFGCLQLYRQRCWGQGEEW